MSHKIENLAEIEALFSAIARSAKLNPSNPANKRLMEALSVKTLDELLAKLDGMIVTLKGLTPPNPTDVENALTHVLDFLDKKYAENRENNRIRHQLAVLATALSVLCFLTGNKLEQSLMLGVGLGACLPDIIKVWKKTNFD